MDGARFLDVYGVDTAHARSSGSGYDLDVRYATVSRPALATPSRSPCTTRAASPSPSPSGSPAAT